VLAVHESFAAVHAAQTVSPIDGAKYEFHLVHICVIGSLLEPLKQRGTGYQTDVASLLSE
jgi:hypothetical protein